MAPSRTRARWLRMSSIGLRGSSAVVIWICGGFFSMVLLALATPTEAERVARRPDRLGAGLGGKSRTYRVKDGYYYRHDRSRPDTSLNRSVHNRRPFGWTTSPARDFWSSSRNTWSFVTRIQLASEIARSAFAGDCTSTAVRPYLVATFATTGRKSTY